MKTVQSPHDIASSLAKEFNSCAELNEADTRHRVIDVILHQVLAWPRSSVTCESFIDPGYADYVLLGPQENNLLFIEAKKEGVYFTLPASANSRKESRIVKIKTLLTTPTIRNAAEQVRTYCVKKGCEYAAITNGHQWIFFKTFERQRDWEQLNAFVVTSLDYFASSFTDACTNFSYTSITENGSLAQLLGTIQAFQRELFHPKTRIASFNHEVTSNHLARFLRPLAMRYLGTIDEHDDEFMDRCYVNLREYQASVVGVNKVIYDCLSPYFINYNVKEFFDDGAGGILGDRIASNLRERRTREVIILFGGKGSGKSTFIRKLLYHRPPRAIKEFAIPVVIDLLLCRHDTKHIENEVWAQLIDKLDTKKILKSDRADLLELFADKYQHAKRQLLAGLSEKSTAYIIKLGELLQSWLEKREYCAIRLADYWKRNQKGLIVVLDNTDQFPPELQDYSFTLAQSISTRLDCLVVISMREERFYYSKLHGTLDAFQNTGFHLSSPPPHEVFDKRLLYLLELLDTPQRVRKVSPDFTEDQIDVIKKLIRVVLRDFRSLNSRLDAFLQATAHGNMRIALEMFSDFLLSGYTRVDEMIQKGGWTLATHQVLRPMMVPYHFFYTETRSKIPNIYQIRSPVVGSHFTAMRILTMLSTNMSPANPAYIPLAQLRAYFATTFNMLEDLHKNLDVLLRTGIIESDNRLDEYSDSIDSLKITPYGYYMIKTLCFKFNYLDLVGLDCAIHDESVAHSQANLAQKDIDLFLKSKKLERVQVRLKRTQEFIDYLKNEEDLERSHYFVDPSEVPFTPTLLGKFALEKEHVLGSARRNYGKAPKRELGEDDLWDDIDSPEVNRSSHVQARR
jgi:hypothetical protein